MKIAVVGAGISGLGAALALTPRHEVTLFERDERLGGHANTLEVEAADGRRLALDTGFLVYNEKTYPRLVALFENLGVPTQQSSMSLSVRCEACRIEWSGRGPRGVFARPSQLFRPAFYRMLVDIVRFNRAARAAVDDPKLVDTTLAAYLESGGYSEAFRRHYLLPMGGAIWSQSNAVFEGFPLRSFLAFFQNHGLLTVDDHPEWRTVTGGSREYVRAAAARLADVRTGIGVRAIRREPERVVLRLEDGSAATFDRVVIATHSDQALAMLEDPSAHETTSLGAIRYTPNEAILHTDRRLLPRNRSAWSSWNVHTRDCHDAAAPLTMTYHLNTLQGLDTPEDYGVTLNDAGAIDPARILARIDYAHPEFTFEGLAARERLRARNGERRTAFAGAYLGYGFHEDGLRSGDEAALAIEAERAAA